MKSNFTFFIKNYSVLLLLFFIFNSCSRNRKFCETGNTGSGGTFETLNIDSISEGVFCNRKNFPKDIVATLYGQTASESSVFSKCIFTGFTSSISEYAKQGITFDIIDTITMVISSSDASIAPIVEKIAVPKNSGTKFSHTCSYDILPFPDGSLHTVQLTAHFTKHSFQGNISINSYMEYDADYCYYIKTQLF